MLYPATEERIWAFERCSYWIHHILILLVPLYLHQIYSGHQQQNNNNENETEENRQILQNPFNLSWFLHAYAVWMIGNGVFVHAISYLTMVNINVTLCPVNGVPGYGENYRIHNFYWVMIFFIISAVFYSAMTRFTSYLCLRISTWNANNTYTNINYRCQTTNRKAKKEE